MRLQFGLMAVQSFLHLTYKRYKQDKTIDSIYLWICRVSKEVCDINHESVKLSHRKL